VCDEIELRGKRKVEVQDEALYALQSWLVSSYPAPSQQSAQLCKQSQSQTARLDTRFLPAPRYNSYAQCSMRAKNRVTPKLPL
jgi:hypothetical protein